MEYRIVGSVGSTEELEELFEDVQNNVNELCKEEFEPIGNISLTINKYGTVIVAQGMVKRK